MYAYFDRAQPLLVKSAETFTRALWRCLWRDGYFYVTACYGRLRLEDNALYGSKSITAADREAPEGQSSKNLSSCASSF